MLYLETRGLVSFIRGVVLYLRTGGIPDVRIIPRQAYFIKG